MQILIINSLHTLHKLGIGHKLLSIRLFSKNVNRGAVRLREKRLSGRAAKAKAVTYNRIIFQPTCVCPGG